jgi:hypothetical protein
MAYSKILGKQGTSKLREWVQNGGTLLAVGTAAAFAADSSVNLSQVRLYRQSLDKLDEYQEALTLERLAEKAVIDSAAIWGEPKEGRSGKLKKGEPEPPVEPRGDLEELKAEDERACLFMPRGAILRGNLDTEHWLTSGLARKVPVILYSEFALLSRSPVETAARLSEADSLRLSGLLWPEARGKWQQTAYLTREGFGKGQVILFAGEPHFRAYFYGSGRLLINAILLGPGFGTSQTEPWQADID